MILYLDASALVKRYVAEPGTPEVARAIAGAKVIGTSIVSRAEIVAALAEAIRMDTLAHEAAASALQAFRGEWPNLVRIQTTEMLVARADGLAWELGLRGYDAVHLASALLWRDAMDEEVTMATYHQQLWEAAGQLGLIPFPEDEPGMLGVW